MKANVLEYLEESAKTHPDSCAVIDEHGTCTYAQLHETSRRVGSALAKAGVRQRGVIVAMEKGADALAAQLGVLYAGGYYVPVAPDIPVERLSAIVDALGGALLIADDSSKERIADMSLEIVSLRFADISRFAIDDEVLAAVRDKALETDPAYALFTSGSTGVPKGVVISHRAILSFIDSFVGTFGIRDTDRIGNQAPFDFDVSTKDIYSTLAASAMLVVIPRRLFMQPAELTGYLERHRVTVLIWAVAALCLLSTYHALESADLSTIRSVLFSGEIMPAKHLKAWRGSLPQATFVNLYGPTEITCNCLYHILDPEDEYAEGVPLGIPFGHCDVLLVDGEGREVTQPGSEGELLVRGPSLALGYLGQPELTSKVFCQNPLNGRFPDRVYRTGDVASFDECGRLFFRGRKDNQIKHQGHRIELEEIDLAFERLDGVDRCRCAYDGKRKLVRAFYEGPADEAGLAETVREALPAFMRPASIRRVTDMPLNKNGKVDRSLLLAPAERNCGEGVAMFDVRQIEEMAESCQTPFYLFDELAVEQRIDDLRSILPVGAQVCYAMKANPFILKAAASASDFVEVCSPGELDICRAVGIPEEQLVISGVYKEPAVMRELIGSGAKVHRYTVESAAQYELLESIAREENTVVPVLLRLTSGNQFGMDASELKRIVCGQRGNQHVECHGVQFFSGTQKSSRKKLAREIEMLDSFMVELSEECGCDAFELEYGPGLPVDYCEEDGRSAELADWELLSYLGRLLSSIRLKGALTLEIGRGIAAGCGTYVTRVVDVKRNRNCNYAIVDGGKHQMVYYGQALALKPPVCAVLPERSTGEPESWAICGALCTTGDILVKQVDVDDLRVGDCVAFPNAGAYCMTEGLALFLSRDLPRVYLCDGHGVPRLVRDRTETSALNTPKA